MVTIEEKEEKYIGITVLANIDQVHAVCGRYMGC